jgi:hypothetical protein
LVKRFSFLQHMLLAPLLRIKRLQQCGLISESFILFNLSTRLCASTVLFLLIWLHSLKSVIVIPPALLFHGQDYFCCSRSFVLTHEL